MTRFELMNELENYTLDGLKNLQHRIARLIVEQEEAERETQQKEEELCPVTPSSTPR